MTEERSLSVSEAMQRAKGALESVRLTVVGEVSEFSDKPGYKAAYFTISDAGASMPCLMWRDIYEAAGTPLRCGMQVEITGFFTAYAPKGRMQFQVRRLQPAGEGRLRMQVAEIARKLQAEGLMAPERKRALPAFPDKIAVVTSPRGKAVHDVLRTLRRRYPLAEVLLAGVAVEGENAPAAIAEGMAVAAQAGPDVILLVRGGGSYEDLLPFSSEIVARAVATSPVPVVTGIGHEPDTSIADMVADLRASTPTAAAESVAPAVEELANTLRRERRALGRALAHRVQAAAHRVQRIAERPAFADPRTLLGTAFQTLDLLGARLNRAIPESLRRDRERMERVKAKLVAVGPRISERAQSVVALQAARLDNLSPLKILGRGYAAAFGADGHTVVRSVGQVNVGERIVVKVSDGQIGCSVNDVVVEER
ncbi:MAG TPA: exodeoxyribonuclease VII large subunit [Coriobacteriia bacterium]|nr:exodeoxyribonuclease VII large subunit [Coriobacteriia bacterium]